MRCAVVLFSALMVLTAAAASGRAARGHHAKARANATAVAAGTKAKAQVAKAKPKPTVKTKVKAGQTKREHASVKKKAKATSRKTAARRIHAQRQERADPKPRTAAIPDAERAAVNQPAVAPPSPSDTLPPPFSPREPIVEPTPGARTEAKTDASAPLPPAAARRDGEAVDETSTACLERLRASGAHFEAAAPTQGVRTPIIVSGPLGRVHLVHRERRGKAPLMDCELARALLEVEPILAELGVDELRFSGAYQYRVRRGTTRLSEHAHGLAIDVHTFHLRDGRELDVLRDFAAGAGVWGALPPDDEGACVGSPSNEAGRLLRSLGCRLRMSSALRTVMTPDDDEDHRNHFHIETFPDPGTRARIILQRGRARTE